MAEEARDPRAWEDEQCETCKYALACYSGALLREYYVAFCVRCDDIMLVKPDSQFFFTLYACDAGHLDCVAQFRCMPRLGGFVREHYTRNLRRESRPMRIYDTGPTEGIMYLFACPGCTSAGLWPRR
jgi:hypothetical protein